MTMANEITREDLLLRDVTILFKEVVELRNKCTVLERENAVYREEFDKMSNLLTIYQNSNEQAFNRLRVEAILERDVYIDRIKLIRKKYKLRQKELSKLCFYDVTAIENKRRNIETTKDACMKIEILAESGELQRYIDEREAALYED